MKVGKLFNNIYVKNLLLAIAVFLLLIFAVLKWLDVYTRHGQEVEVPVVKGMQVGDAVPFFENRSLKCLVIDSIFDKYALPGSIVETFPPMGSHVKEGRTIYITINSITAQLIAVPDVKEMSQRQALATLRSLGFENVQVKEVPGRYRDLVQGVELLGATVQPGDKLKGNSPLSLLVSSGVEPHVPEDTTLHDGVLIIDDSSLESWF